MPRITIPIADDLLKLLKDKAAEEKRTVDEVANDLLRLELRRTEMQPGVGLTDLDKPAAKHGS